jgi:hypothetical protein
LPETIPNKYEKIGYTLGSGHHIAVFVLHNVCRTARGIEKEKGYSDHRKGNGLSSQNHRKGYLRCGEVYGQTRNSTGRKECCGSVGESNTGGSEKCGQVNR